MNTVAGVASLLASPGGLLPDLLGYPAFFVVATALALGSFALTWPLAEPRGRPAGS